MHSYLLELATLMAIFSFAIVSPGADLAMVMRQSLMHGRRAAIVTSFGIGTALMVHVTYTILGLGLIISQSIALFNIVKWCGVAYLLYIGIKALRAGKTDLTAHDADAAAPESSQSALKAFGLGFAVNALNPKAVFFFLSIFSTVVSAHNADRRPVRLRAGDGRLAGSVVRRRQPVHDDAQDARGLLARQPVDRPRRAASCSSRSASSLRPKRPRDMRLVLSFVRGGNDCGTRRRLRGGLPAGEGDLWRPGRRL